MRSASASTPEAQATQTWNTDCHCQHGRLGEAAATAIHCYCPPPPPPAPHHPKQQLKGGARVAVLLVLIAGRGGGRLWTAYGQRRVDSKNSQMTPATASTSSIRQLLGAADTQTAHHATFSTAPTHQLLGSTNANAETTPARAPAAAADRTQRPDATCEGKSG